MRLLLIALDGALGTHSLAVRRKDPAPGAVCGRGFFGGRGAASLSG